jgi:hypothetical protein
MDPSLIQTGFGLAVVVLVLERVYAIIKITLDSRGSSKTSNGNAEVARTLLEIIQEMQHQIGDLHEWHKKEDSDGRKIWYGHSGVDKALEHLATSHLAQTKLLEHLVRSSEVQGTSIDDIHRTLADLYSNISSYRETICPFRESTKQSKPRNQS